VTPGGGGAGKRARTAALHQRGAQSRVSMRAVTAPTHPVRFLGVAKSSLGDAKSSLGDAKSSLGDAKSSLLRAL
jgi:hypothetical protein